MTQEETIEGFKDLPLNVQNWILYQDVHKFMEESSKDRKEIRESMCKIDLCIKGDGTKENRGILNRLIDMEDFKTKWSRTLSPITNFSIAFTIGTLCVIATVLIAGYKFLTNK